MSAIRDESLDAVAANIRRWLEFVPDSPLYRRLTAGVIDDDDLLRVVAAIPNVPPMNLLFAAVKYLLRDSDDLAPWYPHLTDHPREADESAFVAFRSFVLDRRDDVALIAGTHTTQTNEVARSAVILPWLAAAAKLWDEPPHAVDIGAAAGLNLCLDGFSYRYGDHVVGTGKVVIECENRGGFALPDAVPRFASRTGLDLHPINVDDPDQVAWLKALVWPEHADRLALLEAALEVRRRTEVTMIAGDAVETLVGLEKSLPPGPLLAWHTVALYQFSDEQRRGLDSAFAMIAARRPVARVGLEGIPNLPGHWVRVGVEQEGAPIVAHAQGHGRWVDRP